MNKSIKSITAATFVLMASTGFSAFAKDMAKGQKPQGKPQIEKPVKEDRKSGDFKPGERKDAKCEKGECWKNENKRRGPKLETISGLISVTGKEGNKTVFLTTTDKDVYVLTACEPQFGMHPDFRKESPKDSGKKDAKNSKGKENFKNKPEGKDFKENRPDGKEFHGKAPDGKGPEGKEFKGKAPAGKGPDGKPFDGKGPDGKEFHGRGPNPQMTPKMEVLRSQAGKTVKVKGILNKESSVFTVFDIE